jgi:hypothetical protein
MGKERTSTHSASVKGGWPKHFNYARKENVRNDGVRKMDNAAGAVLTASKRKATRKAKGY